jgi:small conductance mechanosensitive channel
VLTVDVPSLVGASSGSPSPTPSSSSLYDQTANAITWPFKVLLTVVIAVVVAVLARWILHRLIDHLVRQFTDNALARRFARTKAGTTIGMSDEQNIERMRQRTRTVGGLLKSVSTFVIFTIAVVAALATLGFNVAPILASAGVIGIAVGFGAQSLIKDFLTGVFMIMEDQYGVGDVIDTGQAIGTVEEVGLRVTRLRDDQGVIWYVPNGAIMRVGNRSHGWAVAAVDVPISHSEDLDRAVAVVRATVETVITDPAHADDVLDTPPTVHVESISAFGVTLRVTVRTQPLRNGPIAQTLRARVLEAFDREGIASPGLGRAHAAGADDSTVNAPTPPA